MKVFWTKESIFRLNEIESYIKRDNPISAVKFIDHLISHTERLSKNPERGRIVPEFSIKVIRELLYKNYGIVYLIKKKRIEVLTVFEGNQLLKKEDLEKNIKKIRDTSNLFNLSDLSVYKWNSQLQINIIFPPSFSIASYF